jgi:outer membrane protein assembly factor BamB
MGIRTLCNAVHRGLAIVMLVAVGSSLLSACDWAQFRFGPEGTGFNPFESTIGGSNVSGLQARWSELPGPPSLVSSPVAANGDVYVSTDAGTIDAFDAITGTARWSYAKGSPNEMCCVGTEAWLPAPAVASGVVYDLAGDGTLYAIDATSGTKLWSTAGADSAGSLVVADGIVYVDSLKWLAAFNATTGAPLWSSTIGMGRAWAQDVPAVANGVIYTTPQGLTDQLYAQNATTGAVLWSAQTSETGGGSSPAVSGGVVYVEDPGTLFAFHAGTGVRLWSAAAGDPIGVQASSAAPAVAYDIVYETANDGTLVAFNATTGAQLWSTPAGTTGATSPIVANDVVYVGGSADTFKAFDATTGSQLWSSYVASSVTLPIVADGVIYASLNDGTLDAYSLPTAGAGLTVWPSFAPDYGTVLDGTRSRPTTFTITNFGSSATSALSDALTGADQSQFHVTSDTCTGANLAGGSSCSVQVAFTPTLTGRRTANLVVSAATGGAAGATLSGTGNPLAIAPHDMNFGFVADGTSSPPATFTVKNVGPTSAHPTVASLAGSQFAASSDTCSGTTLAAGASCRIAIAFTPSSVGATSASLSVSSAPGITATAGVSGIATPIGIAPPSKNFGTVPVGSSSHATFTIDNLSSTVLPLPLAPSTTTGNGFSISSDACNGLTLAAGATCAVSVTFTPALAGTTYNGQLSIALPLFGPIGRAQLFGKGA